jgi:hypothetical protein
MEKHGNQFFPQDRVRVLRVGAKTSSAQEGRIVSVTPETGMAQVELMLGDTVTYVEMVSLSEVEKISE